MKFLIVCALALVFLPASTFAIVLGEKAAIGQFPHQCRLAMTDAEDHSSSCGGALISNKCILTAAHCVRTYVDIEYIDVYLGTTKRVPSNIAPIRVMKNKIVWHPKYSTLTRRNDIALVKIPPVTFTAYIQPVMLPPSNFKGNPSVYDNEVLVLSGWGRISYLTTNTTEDLQFIETKGIPMDICKAAKNKLVVNEVSNLCTIAPNGGAFCLGDSGSPLVWIKNNIAYLVGIVSLGTKDSCGGEEPDLYTRVDNYGDWIEANSQ